MTATLALLVEEVDSCLAMLERGFWNLENILEVLIGSIRKGLLEEFLRGLADRRVEAAQENG